MFTLLLAAVLSLDGNWNLTYWPQPDAGPIRTPAVPADAKHVSATVPGNCELDLVRAGVLPEPEVGLNVFKFHDYEGHQWLYTKDFDFRPIPTTPSTCHLVFDGIDTLADIFLNGEKIGEGPSRHRLRAGRRAPCELIPLRRAAVRFRAGEGLDEVKVIRDGRLA